MSFASGGFLIFLPLMVLCYWICPARWRYLALLAGSLLFYMGWSVPLTLLPLGVTLLNWVSCLIVEKHKSKWLLGILLTLIFLPLAVCKYAGFFAGSLHSLLGWPGQGEDRKMRSRLGNMRLPLAGIDCIETTFKPQGRGSLPHAGAGWLSDSLRRHL